MDVDTWKWTYLDNVPSPLSDDVRLLPEELPIVSCCLGSDHWYVMTTSRVIGCHESARFDFDPRSVVHWQWRDFKGVGFAEIEIARARLRDERCIDFSFETGKASMAPIYYERFWTIKYPIVDKLTV